MSDERAEAINLGPNNPVSDAEALREEVVAERINPGDPGVGAAEFPEEKAERINPGPNDLEVPGEGGAAEAEALSAREHRIDPGPQG